MRRALNHTISLVEGTIPLSKNSPCLACALVPILTWAPESALASPGVLCNSQQGWRSCFDLPSARQYSEGLRVLHSELQESQFHKHADQLLDHLQERLEAYVEDLGIEDADVEYASGVLTVKLGPKNGTYVINKQTPNRQIWLSSPVRYDYSNGRWLYHRTGQDMLQHLERELVVMLGVSPHLDAE